MERRRGILKSSIDVEKKEILQLHKLKKIYLEIFIT